MTPLRRRSISKNVSLPEWLQLLREVNTILFPWFVMWKHWSKDGVDDASVVKSEYYDGRPGTVRYEIQMWKVTRAIEIIGTAKFGVPTEFDYHVFLAMLVMQAKAWKNPSFDVNITEIINILRLSDGGRSYKDIADSIERISTTTYQIDNIFHRKADSAYSKSFLPEMTEEESREYQEFAASIKGLSNNEITTEVEMGKDNRINIKQRAYTHIKLFDMELWLQEENDDTGEIIKGLYRIHFSDFILNAISEKYFFFIDANKLLELRSAQLKRFYEIIIFQSNKRRFVTVEYDRLALMIPLNSGRMNKTYIIKYAQELKDLAYIVWFDTSKEKKSITIEFLSGESIDGAAEPILIGASDTMNRMKLWIRAILNRKKISSFTVEEIYDLINFPGVNKMNLPLDAILGNLEYTLRARKADKIESVLGYLRLSIANDWAWDYKKKKEKRPTVIESQISIGLDDQSDVETLFSKKDKQKAVFDLYISEFSEDALKEMMTQYGVKENINITAKKSDLRIKLFKEGVLSI